MTAPNIIPQGKFEPVSSLCTVLKQLHGCAEHFHGYISEDDHKFLVYTSKCYGGGPVSPATLDYLLSQSNEPRLKRVKRYKISLALASSVLQLLDSPWMPESFTFCKRDIVFVPDADDPQSLVLDRPYIKKDLIPMSGRGAQDSESPRDRTPH